MFRAGYALALYVTCNAVRMFKFEDEHIRVPLNAIPLSQFGGWPVAPIERVRAAAL